MEEQDQSSAPVQIRGRDLPGAVNVLPAGLGELLAKRESREFNLEQSSNSMSFSTGLKSGAKVEQSFSTSSKSVSSSFASSSISTGGSMSQQFKTFGQQSQSSSQEQQIHFQQKQEQEQRVIQQQQQQEQRAIQQQQEMLLLQQQQEQRALQQQQEQRILQQQKQQQILEQHHGEEIKQESLKSTLYSAITDIEEQLDGGEFDANKENHLPQQQFHQKSDVESSLHQQNGIMTTDSPVARRFKFPHEFKGRPQSLPDLHLDPSEPLDLPEVGSGTKRQKKDDTMSSQSGSYSTSREEYSVQQKSEHSTTINGGYHEESNSHSSKRMEQTMLSGSSAILEKVMTPCSEFDSSSLKRRNPRQMFTDSAFYSPKFHPSVAEQVEMAHRLSSSLYDDGNKMSKGQEMYLKRMKKSGVDQIEYEELPQHDKVPNLKLVMNPDGKLHDWTDVPEDDLPELQQIAAGGQSLEIAHNVAENLQACKGRGGELFAKRRKKADKWIVDESSIGSTAPSQFADHFLQQQMFQQQQFQMQQQQEYQEQRQRVETEEEHERLERQQFQEQQQQIFQQQQLQKQQQSMEMRQMNAMRQQQNVDLPPDFKPYSLKGRSFTPTFDTSIHNVQGINVWANKAPKPFGQSSTLPRTATPSHSKTTYAEMPEVSLRSEVVPQVAVCPATPQVSEELIQSSSVQQHSSQTSSQVVSTVVKTEQVVQRDAVDLEEQKRREYEIWFKNQEREQQMLEYDCSVKYEEKQAHQQQEEVVVTKQTVVRQHQTNITSKGVNVEATIPEEPSRFEKRAEPVVATPDPKTVVSSQPDIPEIQSTHSKTSTFSSQQAQEQEYLLRQQQEQELLRQQQEQELLRQQEEQRRLNEIEEQRRLKELEEKKRLEEQKLREQEEKRRIQQQEEQRRLQEQEEQRRILQQQQEQQRILEQQEEQRRLQQQQEEQRRIQQQQEEQRRILQQQEEQRRIQQQQEEQQRLQIQQEEQRRIQLQKQQEEQRWLQQQQEQAYFQQQQQQSVVKQEKFQSYQETHHHHQELHHSELSMQMKSGGLMYREDDTDVHDYVGSLRPTTTGSIIRTEGDVVYTQAPSFGDHDDQEAYFSEVELRKTSTGGKKDLRQSGVFVGIFGESNALVNSSEAFDYEKHSVRSLVDHFSKTKPKEAPKQLVQQNYQNAQAPPLSYLKDQAKGKQFQYQEKGKQGQGESVFDKKEDDLKLQEMMMRRRNSLKDYLLMEFSEGTSSSSQHSAHQLLDPSTILKVDGSVVDGPAGRRLKSSSRDMDSQGRGGDLEKWDNHNAIARGWKTIEDSYHPVTFRRIYGVEKQVHSLHTTASAPQLAPLQNQSPDHHHHQYHQDEEELEAIVRSEAVLDTDEADL